MRSSLSELTRVFRSPGRLSRAAGALIVFGIASGRVSGQSIYKRSDLAASLLLDLSRCGPAIDPQVALEHAGLAPDTAKQLLSFERAPLGDISALSASPSQGTLAKAEPAIAQKCPGPEQGNQRSDNLVPLAGMPSQADLVQGLVGFLVERGKDEFTFAFVDEIRSQVKTDTLLRRLFPHSFVTLGNLGSASFGSLIPTIRQSFATDLDGLPLVLGQPATYGTPTNRDKLDQIHIVGATAVILDRIRNGAAPADALSYLATLQAADVSRLGARVALVHVGIFAREFVAAGGTKSGSVLKSKLQDPAFAQFFSAFFLSDEVKAGFLGAMPTEWQRRATALVQQGIADVGVAELALGDIDATIRDLKQSISDGKATSSQAFASAAQGISNIVSLSARLATEEGFVDSDFAPYLKYVTSMSEMYSGIVNHQYAPVVVSTIQLLQANASDLSESQVRVLSFASALASAQSPDDVTKALEASAVPVTSFITKRRAGAGDSRWQFAVNAYLGGIRGHEDFDQPDTRPATFLAPAAPVGAELSYAIPRQAYLGISTVSVFVPVIDVGTLASNRLGATDTVSDPQPGFSQVLAPGAFVVLGLTRSFPISLGYGFQRVPKLRSINGGPLLDVTRHHAFFVGADIPIFKF